MGRGFDSRHKDANRLEWKTSELSTVGNHPRASCVFVKVRVDLEMYRYIFALNKTYLFVTFFFKSQAIFFAHLYGLTDP